MSRALIAITLPCNGFCVSSREEAPMTGDSDVDVQPNTACGEGGSWQTSPWLRLEFTY